MQSNVHKYIRLLVVSITDIVHLKLHKYYVNLHKTIRLKQCLLTIAEHHYFNNFPSFFIITTFTGAPGGAVG